MSIPTDKFYVFNHNFENLNINDDIKVTSSMGENIWIKVVLIDKENIIGTVMHDLIRKHNFNKDDLVKCKIKHIRCIYKNS